jgi:hypothetical protein
VSLKPFAVLVAIVAFCATLVAQQKEKDPFLGVWELNHAKSHFTQRAAPKSQTFVMVVEPGGFRSTRATLNEDNTTSVEIHHYNFDGNFHETEGGDQRALSFKRVDKFTIDETAKRTRNGQVNVSTRRIQLSPDGKTMTLKATNAEGRAADDVRVYDKRDPEILAEGKK